MSLFTKIKTLLFGTTTKVAHPFWGQMLETDTHYQCQRAFAPTNSEVVVELEKKEVSTIDQQTAAFEWISENYAVILDSVVLLLQRIGQERQPDFVLPKTIFQQTYTLKYITLPTCENQPFDWEISFCKNNTTHHYCTIAMHGLRARDIVVII